MTKNFEIRKYNIRLTKDGLKAPVTKRAKRAVVTVKRFIEKNTRAERGDVIIGNELNNELWKNGIKNPPRKVKVFVQKIKDDKVFVNLEGASIWVEKKKVEKKEEKSKEAKPKEKVEVKEETPVKKEKVSEKPKKKEAKSK